MSRPISEFLAVRAMTWTADRAPGDPLRVALVRQPDIDALRAPPVLQDMRAELNEPQEALPFSAYDLLCAAHVRTDNAVAPGRGGSNLNVAFRTQKTLLSIQSRHRLSQACTFE